MTGGKFTDHSIVEGIAKQNIEGKYFFLIKKSNYFFYPRFEIAEEVQEKFISIKELKLTRNSFNEISAEIVERAPTAVSCKNETKTECYLIDEEGLIFAMGPLVTEEDAIELANFYPNLNIGEKYQNTDAFKKVISLASMMREKSFHPDLISTEDNESYSIHISEGPRVFYEKGDDPKEVLINLLTVIEKDSLNKSQFQNIDYIDLRFGNKVYYKIK